MYDVDDDDDDDDDDDNDDDNDDDDWCSGNMERVCRRAWTMGD